MFCSINLSSGSLENPKPVNLLCLTKLRLERVLKCKKKSQRVQKIESWNFRARRDFQDGLESRWNLSFSVWGNWESGSLRSHRVWRSKARTQVSWLASTLFHGCYISTRKPLTSTKIGADRVNGQMLRSPEHRAILRQHITGIPRVQEPRESKTAGA